MAIKLILKLDDRHIAMFQCEAQVVAPLEHDNIVRVCSPGSSRRGGAPEVAGSP